MTGDEFREAFAAVEADGFKDTTGVLFTAEPALRAYIGDRLGVPPDSEYVDRVIRKLERNLDGWLLYGDAWNRGEYGPADLPPYVEKFGRGRSDPSKWKRRAKEA